MPEGPGRAAARWAEADLGEGPRGAAAGPAAGAGGQVAVAARGDRAVTVARLGGAGAPRGLRRCGCAEPPLRGVDVGLRRAAGTGRGGLAAAAVEFCRNCGPGGEQKGGQSAEGGLRDRQGDVRALAWSPAECSGSGGGGFLTLVSEGGGLLAYRPPERTFERNGPWVVAVDLQRSGLLRQACGGDPVSTAGGGGKREQRKGHPRGQKRKQKQGRGASQPAGAEMAEAARHHALCAAWSPVLVRGAAGGDFCVLAAGTKGGGFALVRCELQDDGEANPASLFSALGALPTRGAYATAVACARAPRGGLAVVGGDASGAVRVWALGTDALSPRDGGRGGPLEAGNLELEQPRVGGSAVARVAVSPRTDGHALRVAWARRDDQVFACEVVLPELGGSAPLVDSDWPVRRVAACCPARSPLTGLFWAGSGEVLCSTEIHGTDVLLGYPWETEGPSAPSGRAGGGDPSSSPPAPPGASAGGIFGASSCGRGFMATAVVGRYLGVYKIGGIKYSLKLQVLDLLPLVSRGAGERAEKVAAQYGDAASLGSPRGLLDSCDVWELTASVQAALRSDSDEGGSAGFERFSALLQSLEGAGGQGGVSGYRSLCLAAMIRRAMSPHVSESAGQEAARAWGEEIERNEYAAFKFYVGLQVSRPNDAGPGVRARLAAWGRANGVAEQELGCASEWDDAAEECPHWKCRCSLAVRTHDPGPSGQRGAGLRAVCSFLSCTGASGGADAPLATCAATLAPIKAGGAPWACPVCRRAVARPVPTPLQPDVALPWCPFCATLTEPVGGSGLVLGGP